MELSIGGSHNALLTLQNDVVTFEHNTYNQCTSAIKQNAILVPHIVSKTQELVFWKHRG